MDGCESNKQMLNNYRRENMLLKDKIEHLEDNVIEDLKIRLAETSDMLEKKQDELSYWRHKFDKKNSWLSYIY